MSVLDDMFTKMASLQGHVRVHDCRGMHKSRWAPELGYWRRVTRAWSVAWWRWTRSAGGSGGSSRS